MGVMNGLNVVLSCAGLFGKKTPYLSVGGIRVSRILFSVKKALEIRAS